MGSIMEHFADLPDPRINRTRRHELIDILTISLCAVVCGCDSFTDIALFGEAKLPWFKTFLSLPSGIPSHDTFNRVFAAIDTNAFGRCFSAWISDLQVKTKGGVIAFDGKTLRRSFDHASGNGPLHMVSAWAHSNQTVLGQIAVDGKSNEITAIPKLLDMLDIVGCTVTIDAIGTQKAIAAKIQAKGADYVLALKSNHHNLNADVRAYFEQCMAESWRDAQDQPIAYTNTTSSDFGHGRTETRTCWATACPEWADGKSEWAGLRSIARVEGTRCIDGKTSTEARYYLSSLPPNARRIADAVRAHWSIENRLHWVLDMTFNEDQSRIRTENAAVNMATLRHIALNLITKENSGKKKSIRAKRLLAGWENDYLMQIIVGTKT